MSVLEELEIETMVSLGSWRRRDFVSFLASLTWSTPEPGPTRTGRGTKGKEQQEGLYDLKIGSWQENRVDEKTARWM